MLSPTGDARAQSETGNQFAGRQQLSTLRCSPFWNGPLRLCGQCQQEKVSVTRDAKEGENNCIPPVIFKTHPKDEKKLTSKNFHCLLNPHYPTLPRMRRQ